MQTPSPTSVPTQTPRQTFTPPYEAPGGPLSSTYGEASISRDVGPSETYSGTPPIRPGQSGPSG